MRLFNQSLTLLLSMLFVLIIISTPLASYMAQILGFIIIVSIIFLILKKRRKREQELFAGSNKEIFMITLALVLAVFLTGGLASNLFFLLYFLLFGIVFLFEPETVFVLLIGLLVVFFGSLSEGDLLSHLIKLGSLVFLSPISYFFGREFRRRDTLERTVEDKVGQILEDTQVLRSHAEDEDAIDEIEDIEEKAGELRRETEKE